MLLLPLPRYSAFIGASVQHSRARALTHAITQHNDDEFTQTDSHSHCTGLRPCESAALSCEHCLHACRGRRCGVSHSCRMWQTCWCTTVWAQSCHSVQRRRPYSRPWFSARCEHRVYRNHTWFSFQTPGPASHMAGGRMASTQLTAQLGVDGRSRPAWGVGRDRGQACVLLLTVPVKAGCWRCAARGKWR